MKFQEFTEEVKEKMKELMDESFVIEIQKIRKNNDVVLHGLTIRDPGRNIIPTIYLESFYEYYQNGASFDDVVDKISLIYTESMPKDHVNMDFFGDFEKVRDRIVYRLINAEKNEELLKDIPYIPFHDLAICFCYSFWSPELGDGMILIHNNHMEEWGITHKQLLHLAERNTPELLPISFFGIHEVLRQLNVELELEENEEEQLYVLSNQQRNYGAAVMLYPEALYWVAEQLQSDYYIIPSSVHEVLILRKERFQALQREGIVLQAMIQEINEDQVSAEEVLSDCPYFYDRTECRLLRIH